MKNIVELKQELASTLRMLDNYDYFEVICKHFYLTKEKDSYTIKMKTSTSDNKDERLSLMDILFSYKNLLDAIGDDDKQLELKTMFYNEDDIK